MELYTAWVKTKQGQRYQIFFNTEGYGTEGDILLEVKDLWQEAFEDRFGYLDLNSIRFSWLPGAGIVPCTT